MEALEQVREHVEGCERCELHRTRTNIVFGSGSPTANVMLVGEAPGADEDQTGNPFVGQSGRLLTRLMEKAGLSREEVFITNVLKCRPPGNRDPDNYEIQRCSIFLGMQIEAIRPQVLVAIGRFAATRLSMKFGSMGALLQQDLIYDPPGRVLKVSVIPIYHPAYLLRQGRGKSPKAKALFQDTVDRLERARRLEVPIRHSELG